MFTLRMEPMLLIGWTSVEERMKVNQWSLSQVFATKQDAITWVSNSKHKTAGGSSNRATNLKTPPPRSQPHSQGLPQVTPRRGGSQQKDNDFSPSPPYSEGDSHGDSYGSGYDGYRDYDSRSETSSIASRPGRHRRRLTRRNPQRSHQPRGTMPRASIGVDSYPSFGPDPSIGTSTKIFGEVHAQDAIDKRMGPTDFRSREYGKLYDLAVDVTSLPRMYLSVKSSSWTKEQEEEFNAETTAELVIGIMATKQGRTQSVYNGN